MDYGISDRMYTFDICCDDSIVILANSIFHLKNYGTEVLSRYFESLHVVFLFYV